MAVNISLFAGIGAQLFDDNGVPLVGGKIYSYLAGTTTPATTYTSSSGGTPHTNPIILDAAGRVPGGEIWLSIGKKYKFIVKTSTDVSIATYDNVFGGGGIFAVDDFTGTGSQTVFTLSNSALAANSVNIYINGVYQNKNTYSVSGATLTFSAAPPTTSKIEAVYN